MNTYPNNPFRILEIETSATPEQVKQAYRDLVKVWHPDRFVNDLSMQKRAQEKMKKINDAYERIRALQTNYHSLQSDTTNKEQPKQKHPKNQHDEFQSPLSTSTIFTIKEFAAAAWYITHSIFGFVCLFFIIVSIIYLVLETRNRAELNKQAESESRREASALLTKAQAGEVDAQVQIGLRFEEGNGVPKNVSEAFKWFNLAAQKGNPQAQEKIGSCYLYGVGVTKDMSEGARWLLKAAYQGNGVAVLILSRCYENGDGVPQSYRMAYLCRRSSVGWPTSQYERELQGRLHSKLTEIEKNEVSRMEERVVLDGGRFRIAPSDFLLPNEIKAN